MQNIMHTDTPTAKARWSVRYRAMMGEFIIAAKL